MSQKVSPHHEHKTRWVRVGDMQIDHTYQRPVDRAWSQAIAKDFDPDKLSVLDLSERSDGSLWILDGQQRHAALLIMGWENQKVECRVFTGLTLAQEAMLFDWLNRRKQVKAFFRFRARMLSGEEVAVAVTHIIESCGFHLSAQTVPGGITAVTACEQTYLGKRARKSGQLHPTELRSALQVIREAWGTDPNGVRGEIIKGLGQLFLRDGVSVDKAALATKLATYKSGPAGIVGNARGLREIRGGSVDDAVSEIVVEQYNKGRRVNKLEPWR